MVSTHMSYDYEDILFGIEINRDSCMLVEL